MVFVWKRIEEFVKRLNGKQLAAVEDFGGTNPAGLAQFITPLESRVFLARK